MDEITVGALVTVDAGGPPRDGIVFDLPSREKVMVAMVDPERGPGLRPVHPDTLTERTAEGAGDAALRALIRRTPSPVSSGARGPQGSGHGRAGHARSTMHRTTGK